MRAVFTVNEACPFMEALVEFSLAFRRKRLDVKAIVVPPFAPLHRYLPGLTRKFCSFEGNFMR